MEPKLIEDLASRKVCYRKGRTSLLKKVKELTTLCDVDACAIVYGPGDKVPLVWPSRDKTKELLDKFENAPLSDRRRKNVNQQVYIEQKNKKIENQIVKLKEKNVEKDMSNFMHKIHDDGKSLSDFDASDLCRLLYYVERKLERVRVKAAHSQQQLSPNPPTPPVSLQNDIDFWANLDEQVLEQSFLDLLKEDGMMNSGFDNNIGSNMGLPPFPQHLGDVDMVLPQDNIEGFNLGDIDMVLPPGNFGGLIDESGLESGVLPQGNFIDLNGHSDSGLLYGSSSSEIGGSDIWPIYGNFGGTIGGSDMMLPFSNFEGNICGTFMGGSINNIGLWSHQRNFGVGSSNPNFVGTNKSANATTSGCRVDVLFLQ
ncbi:MADS-box transcription factor PHERES 2, partial [Mucuna pruriens]